MLPIVIHRRKNSQTKLSADFTDSPYIKTVTRTPKVKSVTMINPSPSTTAGKLLFANGFTDTNKKFKKLNQSVDRFHKSFPEDYESILKNRIEKFKAGDSEYISELEIVESVYDEILKFVEPYEKILNTLRDKMKECFYSMAKEDLHKKIEKVKKENSSLLLKINNLSDINSKLLGEKKKLEESNEEYVRIFKQNPDFLINYENIVNQMLGQCELISSQKKEIKRLKRVEDTHMKLLDEVRRFRHLDSSFSDDSPITNKILSTN